MCQRKVPGGSLNDKVVPLHHGILFSDLAYSEKVDAKNIIDHNVIMIVQEYLLVHSYRFGTAFA